MADLTPQQAADLLNVSPPNLAALLDAGEIPFHQTGGRRRIRFADVMAYRERMDEEAKEAVDTLTAEAQDLGLGY